MIVFNLKPVGEGEHLLEMTFTRADGVQFTLDSDGTLKVTKNRSAKPDNIKGIFRTKKALSHVHKTGKDLW